MRKLYKLSKSGSPTDYHEAWLDKENNVIVEHFGELGSRGNVRHHAVDESLSGADNIDRTLERALTNGFKEIDKVQQFWLIIEYTIDEWGTEADLDKRHRLQDEMDEVLGWTGLGHCDGGSTGSGTMEVACPVVEYETAKKVVAQHLASGEFADYTRIYCES